MIHEADPQSRPVVITIFTHNVCPYVRPVTYFQNLAKRNRFQMIAIAIGGIVGLAEGIINDTHILLNFV